MLSVGAEGIYPVWLLKTFCVFLSSDKRFSFPRLDGMDSILSQQLVERRYS